MAKCDRCGKKSEVKEIPNLEQFGKVCDECYKEVKEEYVVSFGSLDTKQQTNA